MITVADKPGAVHTASHPGGTPDQMIDVPEAALTVSPGHQFRVQCGPSGTFGLVSYGNDPNRTFLRFEWGAWSPP
jgi:hypothetical protein